MIGQPSVWRPLLQGFVLVVIFLLFLHGSIHAMDHGATSPLAVSLALGSATSSSSSEVNPTLRPIAIGPPLPDISHLISANSSSPSESRFWKSFLNWLHDSYTNSLALDSFRCQWIWEPFVSPPSIVVENRRVESLLSAFPEGVTSESIRQHIGPILYIGTSHSRNLLEGTCALLYCKGNTACPLCYLRHQPFFSIPGGMLHHIAAPLGLQSAVFFHKNVKKRSKESWVGSISRMLIHFRISHVVLERGPWDLAANNTNLSDISASFDADLTLLIKEIAIAAEKSRTGKRISLTVYLPNAYHPPTYRKFAVCVNPSRQLALRRALLRAFNQSTSRMSTICSAAFAPILSIVDLLPQTSCMKAYTDNWGHHYLGVALVRLSLQVLWHILQLHPPATPSERRPIVVYGDLAYSESLLKKNAIWAERQFYNRNNLTDILQCQCHRDPAKGEFPEDRFPTRKEFISHIDALCFQFHWYW